MLKAAAVDLGLSRLSLLMVSSSDQRYSGAPLQNTNMQTRRPHHGADGSVGWAGTWESVCSQHMWTLPECVQLRNGVTGDAPDSATWVRQQRGPWGGWERQVLAGMSSSWIAGEAFQKVWFWPHEGSYQSEIVKQYVMSTTHIGHWPLVKSSVYRAPFCFLPTVHYLKWVERLILGRFLMGLCKKKQKPLHWIV